MQPEITQRIKQIKNGQIPQGYKKTKIGIVPNDWKTFKIKDCLTKVVNPVVIQLDEVYTQIGIRSHGKGIFYKEPILGRNIGKKSVFWIEPNCFILNIVFAWEQAIGKTTESEIGMIASHRFPMYKPNNLDIDFLIYYFLTNQGTNILKEASPGGAGRNKTLGQDRFLTSKIILPRINEQQKIAKILSTQDKVIELKEKLIEEKQKQKKYLIQNMLTGKTRLKGFTDDWKKVKLREVLHERKEKNTMQNLCICSVAVQKGVISQMEHLGRSYASANTSNYNAVEFGDLVYTKSPTGEFPYGIIKQSQLNDRVAVSPLYGVFKPLTYGLGYMLQCYFQSSVNTYNYLVPLVQKGAKNTINISNDAFLSNELYLPMDTREQKAIAEILSTQDKEIELLQKQLEEEKQKKKALIQLLLTGIVRV